jgi:DNA-binding LytR/AlgR family response regulator
MTPKEKKAQVVVALQKIEELAQNPNITHVHLFGNPKEKTDLSMSELLEALPNDMPLYKDYGVWQISDEKMRFVFYQQRDDETLLDFLKRAVKAEKIKKSITYREDFLLRHELDLEEKLEWQSRIAALKKEVEILTENK